MDPMTLILVAALMLVIGAIAGVLAGLLGVGGGVVLVPAFFYTFTALGFNSPDLMQVCLATSLATIIVTSIRSTQSHHKRGAVDWAILRSVAPGIILGAFVGVAIAAQLSSLTLQIIFGVLGACIGAYFIFGSSSWSWKTSLPGQPVRSVWATGMGFLSVLLGIGGGSLGVPFMTLHGVAIHRAVATAAGFGLAIAVPSVCAWFFVSVEGTVPPFTIGAVNVPAFLIIVPMTILTAPIGAQMAHAMPADPLRKLFGIFLIFVALNMVRAALWN
ncbi:MAG: sulfite exporter TauE/SafE family protein [Pseudomonadota bacterium]